MNHYELSIELLKIREWFHQQDYNDETTKNYFDKSVEQIHEYFMNSDWRNSYLFSSMGYFDNNKTNLIKYRYNREPGFMNPLAIELMESLTQKWINEDESLSITKMFLHESNLDEHYKALFYKLNGKEIKEKLNEFIYLNLNEFSWDVKGSMEMFMETNFDTINFGKYPHYEFNKHGGSKNNPFLNLYNEPSTKDLEQFNRLIAVYLEIVSTIDDNCYFYFIKPHTFQHEFNGIILFGFKKEMSPDEIEHWIDKAERILTEIATKKIEQFAAMKENAQATSHFGHLLRYRLSPPGQYIELIGNEIEKLKGILPENNHSIVDALEKYYKGASIWFEKTVNTGFLLNIKAHYFENPNSGYEVFNQRTIWRTDKSFDLLSSLSMLINELNEHRIQIHTTREFTPFVQKFCKTAIIEQWFQVEEIQYRPFDILYEDLLFEILINAFKASPKDKDIEIKAFKETIKDQNVLVIANRIDNDILRKNSRKYKSIKDNWKTFKEFSGSIGGLTYWSHLIEVTEVGQVYIRTTEEKGVSYFETGLLLKGLNV